MSKAGDAGGRGRVTAYLSALLMSVTPTACSRRPSAVVCSCSYGGVEQRARFAATREPYRVRPIDIGGRFRFKAVYVQEPWQSASIDIYAYSGTDGTDVLLHEGKYLPPFNAVAAGGHYGFTGRQLVYSPTQRELDYWCELAP